MNLSILLATLLIISSSSILAEQPSKREISLVIHWLSNTSETRIHQLRGAKDNKLYLHKDGHKEAVYNRDGKLVRDGINDGSYNYAHPVKEPLKHFNRDILPWIMWGSSKTDPTSVEERLEAYSISLGQGLGVAQKAPKNEVGDQIIESSELRVVEFFLEVLKKGKVESVLTILENPDYEPKKSKMIGEGLTKGLVEVVESNQFKPVNPEKK